MPKHKYSFAPEILEHSRRIARHYRLYDDALLQTAITELRWDESDQRWIVSTNRGDRFKAQYRGDGQRAAAAGRSCPAFPGINEFKGYTFHTSRWDYRYTGGDSSGNLHRPEGQARRHHRHRRHRHPVHSASRRSGEAPLRVPAHAVVRRRAQQPRDRSGNGPRRWSPAGRSGAWRISTSWSPAATRTRTSSTTAGPTSSATSPATAVSEASQQARPRA